MATAFNAYKSSWWRFSGYELRDGYIRPAPKARLVEYDPWEPYRASWAYDPDSATPWIEQRQSAPPYQSLLALLDEFRFGPLGDPTPESAEKLLAWCSEHGLLGILPQRAQIVTLAPRWYPMPIGGLPILGEELPPAKDDKRSLVQFRYFRHNAYVQFRGWYFIVGVREKEEAGHRTGELYQKKLGAERPKVLMQDMRPHSKDGSPIAIITPSSYEEPLSETWGNFFPDVPQEEKETYLYPLPLSDAFWHLYAEKVEDFLMGAAVLAQAIRYVNSGDEYGVLFLNSLVSSASMMLRPMKGSFTQEWRAPSLLACFAVMALQDLTQQRRLLNCETCNTPFVTEAYQARYCSDRCRHTAQKRRYRQRLKEGQDNG